MGTYYSYTSSSAQPSVSKGSEKGTYYSYTSSSKRFMDATLADVSDNVHASKQSQLVQLEYVPVARREITRSSEGKLVQLEYVPFSRCS